jgi:peptidoglycan hydrolase-like protein with peptidoglycan-binding domain
MSLRRGDSGPSVRTLQQRLIAKGYSCGHKGADGMFGADTEQAVMAFQRDEGLSVDGIAGARTDAALRS